MTSPSTMGRKGPWYHPNCAEAPLKFPVTQENACTPRTGCRRKGAALKGWETARGSDCHPGFHHNVGLSLCVLFPLISAISLYDKTIIALKWLKSIGKQEIAAK